MTPPTEHAEAIALVAFLEAANVVYFHVPNETVFLSLLSREEKVRVLKYMKDEGVKGGVPDYFIFTSFNHELRVIAVELKRRKVPGFSPAKPNSKQLAFHDALMSVGVLVIVGYGAEDSVEQLKRHGIGLAAYA